MNKVVFKIIFILKINLNNFKILVFNFKTVFYKIIGSHFFRVKMCGYRRQ